MAHYLLQKGYELCGWEGLPFALRHPNPLEVEFFDRDEYRVVLALDGRHDIDEGSLTADQRKLLEHLKAQGVAVPCGEEARLDPGQEYQRYPATYKRYVQWSVTGRCNYRCRHCFMSAPDYRGEDLSAAQYRHILDELAACGIRVVQITGGEPLIHPRFYELLDEIRRRDILLEVIYSNGRLVDEKLLDELEKRQMRPAFHMSFDGVGWHDWMRGVDGAEEAVIRAFRLLHERGYETSASMCLHRHNIGTLKESVDLLASLGVSRLKVGVASPEGLWKRETEHFITHDEANEAILSYLPQYVADGMPVSTEFNGILDFDRQNRSITIPFAKFSGEAGAERVSACRAARSSMYISASGRVLPCMPISGTAIEARFESILEKPLAEILTKSFYREMCRLPMSACIEHNERCRACGYRLLCGAGCRANACGAGSVDYLGIDEEACHFFKNGWYERAKEAAEKYRNSFPQ